MAVPLAVITSHPPARASRLPLARVVARWAPRDDAVNSYGRPAHNVLDRRCRWRGRIGLDFEPQVTLVEANEVLSEEILPAEQDERQVWVNRRSRYHDRTGTRLQGEIFTGTKHLVRASRPLTILELVGVIGDAKCESNLE